MWEGGAGWMLDVGGWVRDWRDGSSEVLGGFFGAGSTLGGRGWRREDGEREDGSVVLAG